MPHWEQGKLHLDLLGQLRELAFPYATGTATPLDMLPMARAISDGISALSVEQATEAGFSISCGPGCAACCRQLIPIAPLEASALGDLVAALPEPRQREVRARFAISVQRLEQAGLLDAQAPRGGRSLLRTRDRKVETETETETETDWQNVSRRYFALQLECPFLDRETCSIYAERPLICREYQVVTPAAYCQTLDARTQAIPWYVRMSEVLTELGDGLTAGRSASLPLVLALEVAEARARAFRATVDGETIAQQLLDAIAEHAEEPPPLRRE